VACLGLLLARSGDAQPGGPTIQERLGYPANARLLVIHADDLGMSHSVNRATFEALEKGWITSSSILVPCPWFPEVARFAREHPDADLGIHLALNSEWNDFRWRPVSPVDAVSSLLDKDGYLPLDETIVVANAKPDQVDREARARRNGRPRTRSCSRRFRRASMSSFCTWLTTMTRCEARPGITRIGERRGGRPISIWSGASAFEIS